MLTSGTILQERYVIEQLLDHSPFGDLYLARDQRTRQPVDIKAVTSNGANIDMQFSHEAALLASLRHAALPAVVDAFTLPLGRFLVSDHVPGMNLDEVRSRVTPNHLDADSALRLVQPVFDALEYLHSRTPPLLHRDVRPANIRVTTAGQVFLVNYGIAGQVGAPFAAGEPRADLYALGATLYTLLAGTPPPEAVARMRMDLLTPLIQIRPDLAPKLAEAIQRLLALDPQWNYASAAEARRELLQAAPDQICSRCNTANRAGARFCRKCGAELAAADPRGAIRAFITGLPAAPAAAVTAVVPIAPVAPPQDAATMIQSPLDMPTVTAPPVAPSLDAATVISSPLDMPTVTAPPTPPAVPRDAPKVPSAPLDAPTVTTPPRDAPKVPLAPLDAPTVTTPPAGPVIQRTEAAPVTPPVQPPLQRAEAAPPVPPPVTSGAPTAPAGAAKRPNGKLIGGIIAAVVLLAACIGGGYLALQSQGLLPAGLPGAPTAAAQRTTPEGVTPAAGGSAATAEARQNATATAIVAARQQTATARAADQAATTEAGQGSEVQTATAEARQTAAAMAQRTAAAIAAATQTAAVPTATPKPQFLEPQPGTLTVEQYQAQVQGMQRLLFETFDRGERTKAIWDQIDDETRRSVLRDNLYYLTMKTPDQIAWYYWNRDLGATYNLELSVAFQSVGAPASVGIAFDVQPDSQDALFFEITNDKRWQFSTLVNGQFVTERTTQLIFDDIIVDGNGTNTLWVVRKPDEIQLWINSKHVATVPASPFASGQAGACVSSRVDLAEPATVIVDNFLARAPQ